MKVWKIAMVLLASAASMDAVPTGKRPSSSSSSRVAEQQHPFYTRGPLPHSKLPQDQSRQPVFTMLPIKGGVENNPNAITSFFDILKGEAGAKDQLRGELKREILSKTEAMDKALDWASSLLVSSGAAPNSKLVIKSAVKTKSNGLFHIHMKQVLKDDGEAGRDYEIYNADVNINMDAYGNVISFGHNLYAGDVGSADAAGSKTRKGDSLALSGFPAVIEASDAFKKLVLHFSDNEASHDLKWMDHVYEDDVSSAEAFAAPSHHDDETFHKSKPMKHLKSAVDPDFKSFASLGFVQDSEGKTLTKVWNIQADFGMHWIDSHVCVTSGKVKSVHDWVSHANYKVYPLGVNDPEDGKRTLVRDPEDSFASPDGWLDLKEKSPKSTHGNNVWAQANWEGKSNPRWKTMKRPLVNVGNDTFAYKLELANDPHDYVNAATVNLFYWNNIIHDVSYQYGFDEESGNFQDENFGRGGLGNDAVMAMAQAGEGFNNANFATPPDGGRPRMNMYIWDLNTPHRDGDLDAGIIIHEYTHGISTRLTGGPANSNCLWNGEAGGMGEGWGDFVATILRQRPEYTRDMDFLMGSYVYQGKTIRKYPYSTNMKTNPETYAFIKKYAYWGVHAKGEVWAGILLEVYWNFIDSYGFDSDWYLGSGGNNKILKLVLDGMKIQPCNPSFVDARDAILQADKINFNGDNECLIWKGFAKRGLGTKAKTGGHESFVFPSYCDEE